MGNAYISTGFGAWAALLAPAAGRALADLILHGLVLTTSVSRVGLAIVFYHRFDRRSRRSNAKCSGAERSNSKRLSRAVAKPNRRDFMFGIWCLTIWCMTSPLPLIPTPFRPFYFLTCLPRLTQFLSAPDPGWALEPQASSLTIFGLTVQGIEGSHAHQTPDTHTHTHIHTHTHTHHAHAHHTTFRPHGVSTAYTLRRGTPL